jgi:hypothetical protein
MFIGQPERREQPELNELCRPIILFSARYSFHMMFNEFLHLLSSTKVLWYSHKKLQ